VEMRICDAQTTARESDGLAALIAACVLQAARDHDEGVPAPDLAPRLLEENLWRAIRFGLDGKMIDFEARTEYATAAALDRLLVWTEAARGEHGLEVVLPERNGAQRQRALIAEGVPMHEVFAETVRETRATYAAGVTAS
jgi:glutamate---cysteine ligase / carboxylate-amine ligase